VTAPGALRLLPHPPGVSADLAIEVLAEPSHPGLDQVDLAALQRGQGQREPVGQPDGQVDAGRGRVQRQPQRRGDLVGGELARPVVPARRRRFGRPPRLTLYRGPNREID